MTDIACRAVRQWYSRVSCLVLQETNLDFFTVEKCEMVDWALVVSLHVATACVTVSNVTSELKLCITLAHISWAEARLRDYYQHLWEAVRKTALLYAGWQFCNNTHTHTHTHTFNGPLSGTTQVSRYQKGKNDLDFTEARDSEWQWYQLSHMQICTSLQTNTHASTPPLSFLQAGCPYWRHESYNSVTNTTKMAYVCSSASLDF